MEIAIRLADTVDREIRSAIVDSLVRYNTEKTGIHDSRPLVLVFDGPEGRVVGGLWGSTDYAWLFIDLLFVPEELRGRGIGAELMARAEREALTRGCHSAWLDTFEFQARGFYERLGYTCFGELPDYPPGHARYFMKKTLTR